MDDLRANIIDREIEKTKLKEAKKFTKKIPVKVIAKGSMDSMPWNEIMQEFQDKLDKENIFKNKTTQRARA